MNQILYRFFFKHKPVSEKYFLHKIKTKATRIYCEEDIKLQKSFGIIFLYFRTSRKCIEIVVSWIPDSISEFQNRSILMIFSKLLTVLMSPDKTKHISTVVKRKEKWYQNLKNISLSCKFKMFFFLPKVHRLSFHGETSFHFFFNQNNVFKQFTFFVFR